VKRIAIPASEWVGALDLVAPFVHPDEKSVYGHVLLRTCAGRRSWCAIDQWRLTMLEGGDQEGRLEVTLPPRLVEAAAVLVDPEGDAILEIGSSTGGEPALLTVRAGESTVQVAAGPSGFPDVDEITARRQAAPSVTAHVDRAAFVELVGLARRAPLGCQPDATDTVPLFWLEVEPDRLAISVDWPEFGQWRLTTGCTADGSTRVPVGPLYLAEYLDCLDEDDDEVTLFLPADRRTYLVLIRDDWRGYLLPVDRTAEAHRIRVEQQLERIGLGPLVKDHDGDYTFRFQTAALRVRLVEDDPPRVRIFSVVLRGVEESADLLRELNSINASSYLARAFMVDDEVVVGWELIAETLDDVELQLTCGQILRLAEGTGPFLAHLFGGRTVYGDDADSAGENEVTLP